MEKKEASGNQFDRLVFEREHERQYGPTRPYINLLQANFKRWADGWQTGQTRCCGGWTDNPETQQLVNGNLVTVICAHCQTKKSRLFGYAGSLETMDGYLTIVGKI